jgi:anti-sigma regulatory factor (Ser/Thr protein kinase)
VQQTVALPVTEASQVGDARRAAAALAEELGLPETEAGRVALVVTEAASNLVKHARDGLLLLRALEGPPGVEVLALDRGPGMADVGRCLRDGYSTAGSPGTGLGAIARLAGVFDIHSTPAGTSLLSQFRAAPPAPAGPSAGLQIGVVSVPYPGEAVSGDGWAVARAGGRDQVLVVDGLGHGVEAAAAAREAVRAFRQNVGLAPAEVVRALHGALQPTRGAAAAVADLDLPGETLRYAGVGNIGGAVLADGTSRSLVSHNGTLGHALYKAREFSYPFPKGATLVMHSDGLATRWGLDAYPGLALRHPGLIAATLFRDFRRGRDDVTVLAARAAGGGAGG